MNEIILTKRQQLIITYDITKWLLIGMFSSHLRCNGTNVGIKLKNILLTFGVHELLTNSEAQSYYFQVDERLHDIVIITLYTDIF